MTALKRGQILALLVALAACASANGGVQSVADPGAQRTRMVDTQIVERGVSHPAVLEAMRKVPRHVFVPEPYKTHAYADTPLPIGFDQTISQPYIVAYMTAALEPAKTDRVLEIGTGSGYQAAVLAELVREVYTIEIVEPLARRSEEALRQLGYTNIHVRHGNGYLGWPDAAPFDKIIVTAAPDEIPQTLVSQLDVDGIMVVPVGRGEQMMTILRKTRESVVTRETLPVRFVPMVGGDRR